MPRLVPNCHSTGVLGGRTAEHGIVALPHHLHNMRTWYKPHNHIQRVKTEHRTSLASFGKNKSRCLQTKQQLRSFLWLSGRMVSIFKDPWNTVKRVVDMYDLVRDSWENKKGEIEEQISTLLGEKWTFDINPLAIYPYAEEGSYGNTALGNCIFS